MQEGSMTNQLDYIYLGLRRYCERGKLLWDIYCDLTHDETRDLFDDEWVTASNAWKEHRDSCTECGYV